jgi:hypothetical protein
MPLKSAPGWSDTKLEKCIVKATEGAKTEIHAYFNPKEITTDKKVAWKQHAATEGDAPQVEFTAGTPMTFSCELLFDMFETQGNVHDTYIQPLRTLALIDDSLKRPPMCQFTWGNSFPVFTGVVEDMQVTYNLFLPDGTPTRATVKLNMKQASGAMNKDEAKAAADKAAQKKGTVSNGKTPATRDTTGTDPQGKPADADNFGNYPPGTTVTKSGS